MPGQQKMTINAHIDQINDMKEHYPEIATNLNQIANHLKGLCNVSHTRPIPGGYIDFSHTGPINTIEA